ncbi:cytochrome P450 [Coniella lustricola]|uniref:Cytochrome P450 n=1 Tax=Coniella lustricola TaxID=2025994 RepID=A0A2T2ZRZ1_9PEZI|nr:cytochrome P450 [Coniella lustricola]
MSCPIPQPRGIPLLGNIFDVNPANTWSSLGALAAQHGEIFKLTILGNTVVFVSSAALAAELCDERRFRKYVGGPIVQMRGAVHDALFTAYDDEAAWGVAHRICAPVLLPSLATVAQWVREMAGLVAHDLITMRWQRTTASLHADSGAGVLLMDELNRLTLEATTLTLFGRRLGCMAARASAPAHPMLRAMEAATSEAMKRPTRPGFVNWLLYGTKWREAIRTMRNGYAEEEAETKTEDNKKTDLLLDALLQAKDGVTGRGLSEREVVDEIVSMPIGSSTAPCVIASAVYFLCKNREAFAKAREEVDGVLGPWVVATNNITPEHLEQLRYIHAVVREALRLSAAAPGFNIEPIPRTTASGALDTAPVLLGGGKYAVAHNQAMVVVLAGVNTDRAVFGADATAFRPERMLDAAAVAALPAGATKWFGSGKRACIGREWAWVFMVTVVTLLVRRCEWEVVDDDRWAWKQDGWFNLRPTGLRVRVTKRTI